MTPVEDGDGSQWELNVLEPGSYWVVADAYPPAYVSSIDMGGLDLAANPLVAGPGSSLAPIEVTLRDNAGAIAGQVSNLTGTGSGEETQVWIYAIPLFATVERLPESMPSPTGEFNFYRLVPGQYRVVACDAPQEIDFHSPDALAAWTGKGQTVTVAPGGTATAQLNVVHMEPAP